MGCTSSSDTTPMAKKATADWKETFPRHAHTGEMCPYIKEQYDAGEEEMKDIPVEMLCVTEDTVVQKREENASIVEYMAELNKETVEKDLPLVDITDFEIETEAGVMIKIYMIRPKSLPKDGNAAYIWAHGGGAVFFSAADDNNSMAHTALNLQCVVFNVDYRLAPENKAPKGQNDFAAAVRHISKEAAKFGVDKN